MGKTATINTRIEPDLKNETEQIFKQLGLSPSEAITLFYTMVKLNHGLPFEVKIPNPETILAVNDADNDNNLTECKDADDMFDRLGI